MLGTFGPSFLAPVFQSPTLFPHSQVRSPSSSLPVCVLIILSSVWRCCPLHPQADSAIFPVTLPRVAATHSARSLSTGAGLPDLSAEFIIYISRSKWQGASVPLSGRAGTGTFYGMEGGSFSPGYKNIHDYTYQTVLMV